MIAPTTSHETLSIPLAGLTEARVQIGFGGGVMTLGRAQPGTLIAGTFEGGVVNRSSVPGVVELEPTDPGRKLMAGCHLSWDVALTAEIPVDLRIDSGANQSTIDLTPLHVRSVELNTGASETTLKLPTTGRTSVRVECGFAQVTIEVPPGVAARIQGKVSLGATEVDETRFPRIDGGWASADFATAANHVEIQIAGGFGAVRVR